MARFIVPRAITENDYAASWTFPRFNIHILTRGAKIEENSTPLRSSRSSEDLTKSSKYAHQNGQRDSRDEKPVLLLENAAGSAPRSHSLNAKRKIRNNTTTIRTVAREGNPYAPEDHNTVDDWTSADNGV